MAAANRAAEQVEVWQEMVYRTMLQQSVVIEQMLEPSDFQNDQDNYPLSHEHVIAMNWNEIRADPIRSKTVFDDPYLGWFVSLEHSSWLDTVTRSAATEKFRQIVENQVHFWKKVRYEAYGQNRDFFPRWLYWTFSEQQDGLCPSTYAWYPGCDYTGDDETVEIPDFPTCGESTNTQYGTDGLLKMLHKYPQKKPIMYVRKNTFLDSLDMYGIISIGTPSKGIQGFFWIQFMSQYFPKLIDPVLPSSDVLSIDFYIYAPYFLESGDYSQKNEPKFDLWIFQSPNATVEMTEEIFKQQIEVIFQPEVFEYPINGKTYYTYS